MSTNQKPEPSDGNRLKQLSLGLIGVVSLTSLLVLCGWQWDVAVLRQFAPGWPAMNPMAALCFFLVSLSFYLLAFRRRSVGGRKLGYALAILVLLTGLVRTAGFFVPALPAVDLTLYSGLLRSFGQGFHGHMGFNTAVSFVCCGIALLQVRDREERRTIPIHLPILLMGCLCLLSILEYLYGVHETTGVLQYLPMAANSACCFLLLTLALLIATADRGVMKDIIGHGAGRITARRLLPIAIIAPMLLGWLRLYGARIGAFTVEFGVSALVLSTILLFVFVIWYNARLLNRREEEQRKVQEELRVNERTFTLLIGSIRDYAIFMVDPAGMIKSWNPGAQAIKGYHAEEVIGRPINIFYTPEELEKNEPVYNLEMAALNGSYRNEGWRVRKNGARFWAEVLFTALYDSEHRLQGFAKVTRDMSEQKKARDLIRNQARLMEDISDAMITTDQNFNIVTWNKATEKLFGYSLSDAVGKDMGDMLRNPVDPSVRYAVRELLADRGYWQGEMVYYTKKNLPLNVLVSVSGTRDEQNISTGFVIVCRDITERLRAEQRLIKFNEELSRQVSEKTAEVRDIFERVTDAFMAYDRFGMVVYMNSRAKELMSKAGLVSTGRNIFHEFPVAVNSEFGNYFRKALDTQQEQHYEMWSQVLNLWLESHMYPSVNGVSQFFRDITEDKRVKEQLTRSTAELRDIFERVTDAFMAFDTKGNIVYANRRAADIMGPEGAKPGVNVFDFYPGTAESEFGVAFRLAMETQKDQHLEFQALTLNLWIEEHLYPSPKGVSLFFRDVTEEKKVREQLALSHTELRALASHLQDVREEERADIAREIHDELGQQLTGLKMDMAWVDEKLAQEDRPALRQRVADSLQLLDHTIMTVRKIAAELRPGILDDLGLVAAVEWHAEEFEKRSGIRTSFHAGMASRRYPPAMSIGLFRICQEALTNVARHAGAKQVDIFLGYEEDEILLRVSDDGRGLPPKPVGGRKTLGLLGMKERALMMGGRLEMCSEPGKGMTLTVRVPITATEQP